MIIALDVEGVLAETHGALMAYRHFGTSDFQTWDFETDEKLATFNDSMDKLWMHDSQLIKPTTPSISEQVDRLHDYGTVDIVTGRTGVEAEMQDWLAEHDISYNNFVSTDKPKYKFDYDVYIDDNPSLVGRVPLLYFMQRMYNTDVEIDPDPSDGDPETVPVRSLGDVVIDLAERQASKDF